MGGSSLAPLVFSDSFGRRQGYPELKVLDSTEPSSVLSVEKDHDLSRCLFVVSSKSGSTLEPNIFFDYFYGRVESALGGKAGERFVVVTDPGSALEKEAAKRKVRRVFAGDPDIGGRYSALSNFGLVPAALAGVDVAEMLRRARSMMQLCRKEGEENPGLQLGAAIGSAAAAQGRDKLTFFVGPPVPRFGMWIEQLIAESTGKEGRGILPVEGEPPGPPEVYGADRFFAGTQRQGETEIAGRLDALARAGHPAVRFEIRDALDLGAEMFRWEFATAVAGKILGINPFDQPNVQEAKDRTNEILKGEATVPSRDSTAVDRIPVKRLLDSIKTGDYFAITAYLQDLPETEEALTRIRVRVRDRKKIATTVGFGPRFLHSTGQLHKGGPDTGVFLQVTAEPASAVSIPGKPYGFEDVVAAQAGGDLAALRSRGRRALRVHLSKDVAAGLRELDAAVAGALS
ncbi:MAG TPA: glucose-6-phosphate isomerase [Thermoanaerobaculia bacterium]|nr:glucose-6-phosphate isomerase [Thermoanaerobaculia bacterium]